MLSDQEDLPATGENPNYVSIREFKGRVTHVLLSSVKGVEASSLIELIDNDNLSSVLYHPVGCKAKQSEDRFLRVFLVDAVQS